MIWHAIADFCLAPSEVSIERSVAVVLYLHNLSVIISADLTTVSQGEMCRQYLRNRLWLTGLAADLGGALLMIAAFALAPVSPQRRQKT